MKSSDFKKFFEPYSKNVDNAERIAFWQFSSDIIAEIIKENIVPPLAQDDIILDAGGGTAKWSLKLAPLYNCKFVNYDLSKDMLKVASEKILKNNLNTRISNIHGDICDMHAVQDESVNFVISIYSPLSFIDNPEKAANELFRILKPGGTLIIMAHSFYNAIASKINNYIASADEIVTLEKTSRIKWGEHVPELITYSQKSISQLLKKAHFTPLRVYGVPLFVQPGGEDFDPHNKEQSRISKALKDKDFFNRLKKIEMKYNSDSNLVDRGMNIIAVAKK